MKSKIAGVVLSAVWTVSVLAAPELEAHRAFRKAVYAGTAGQRSKAIRNGLKAADPLIRRQALWELYQDDSRAAFEAMSKMTKDPSEDVGLMIAELGGYISNDVKRVAFLKKLIADSNDPDVQAVAVRVMGFPYHRNNVAPSQDRTNDHESMVIAKFDLPKKGWFFRHDRAGSAHLNEKPYFAADYVWRADNAGPDRWRRLQIGKCWEEQGAGAHYDGIGWYQRTFDLPERPAGGDSCELCFDGVDDEAWVWLNGEYIGQHCEGVVGCGNPFRFDVEKELKWGGRNTITVRVNDMGNAGGLNRGIRVEVLKCR